MSESEDTLGIVGNTWWCVTASNAQPRYGYGTAAEVMAWVDRLNGDAVINLLTARFTTDDEWAMCEAGDIGCTIADELAGLT
jgi:hypothetical protein